MQGKEKFCGKVRPYPRPVPLNDSDTGAPLEVQPIFVSVSLSRREEASLDTCRNAYRIPVFDRPPVTG